MTDLSAAVHRKRDLCPYCGEFECEDPWKCEKEIREEERSQMEREIEEVRNRYDFR